MGMGRKNTTKPLYPPETNGQELFRKGESVGWFPEEYLKSPAGAHWAGYRGRHMTYAEYCRNNGIA